MNFKQLLSRADDVVLQELVGAPVVRILSYIDPSLARPGKLRELLLDLHPPDELLRDKGSRQLLLEGLHEDSARALLLDLDLDPGHNPFDKLAGLRIRKDSAKESQLFSFFGEVPRADPPRETKLDRVVVDGNYQLFTHQRKAVRQVRRILDSDRRRVLLHMPTGAGKTRAAMHIIADHLRNQEPSLVIWLAHSEELCDQAAEEFQDAWTQLGNRPINLFRFWGTHDLNLSDVRDGFVVAGLAKAHSSVVRDGNFFPTLADRCSLVIIDEAHQAIAETYALVLDLLVEKQETTGLLGLSATPGRTWADIDEDQKLADFFLGQKVTLSVDGYDNPVDYLIDEGYLARPKFEPLYYDGGNELSYRDLRMLEQALDISPNLLKIISEDDQRNLQIIHRIEQLASSHKRILVFAASVMHSRLLATVLRARGIAADSVTGDTLALDRERIITKFRGTDPDPLVLCNYGVLTAGFDAPKTSAAVIARPTKSLVLYSQMLGRALRGPLAGGNKEAEIVTVIDGNLPGFATPSETFFNWEDVWT